MSRNAKLVLGCFACMFAIWASMCFQAVPVSFLLVAKSQFVVDRLVAWLWPPVLLCGGVIGFSSGIKWVYRLTLRRFLSCFVVVVPVHILLSLPLAMVLNGGTYDIIPSGHISWAGRYVMEMSVTRVSSNYTIIALLTEICGALSIYLAMKYWNGRDAKMLRIAFPLAFLVLQPTALLLDSNLLMLSFVFSIFARAVMPELGMLANRCLSSESG